MYSNDESSVFVFGKKQNEKNGRKEVSIHLKLNHYVLICVMICHDEKRNKHSKGTKKNERKRSEAFNHNGHLSKEYSTFYTQS